MKKTPAYRRHSSRDKAFVEIGGRRVYLPGKYGSPESRSAYHSLVQSDCEEGIHTLDGLCVAYLDHCVRTYSHGEYSNVRSVCKRLLQFARGTAVKDFGPRKLTAFRSWLAADGLSRNYCVKSTNVVKRMFRWATAREYIDPKHVHAMESLDPMRATEARSTSPKTPVPWKHVRPVIRAARPMLADMIRVQWLVGCRPGELCEMKWSDVDRSQDVWRWMPSDHKNAWRGRKLEIYLGPLVQRILFKYDDGQPGYVFHLRKQNRQWKPALHGQTYNTTTYARAITRLQEKLKVPHWSPHQIRHARATRLRSRHGIEAARVALGLASLDTAAIYAEVAVRRARKIAERF